jgi:hypothetical protein
MTNEMIQFFFPLLISRFSYVYKHYYNNMCKHILFVKTSLSYNNPGDSTLDSLADYYNNVIIITAILSFSITQSTSIYYKRIMTCMLVSPDLYHKFAGV